MSTPLVGLIDQAIPGTDVVLWDANKIGGLPVWLNKAPPQGMLKCSLCCQESTLLTQLYCPLGNSAYHRCLYVFICMNQTCRSHCQLRVFRCLKFDPSYNKSGITNSADVAHTMNSDMWTDDQNDWGDDDDNDDWGDNVDEWDGEGSKSMNNTEAPQEDTEINQYSNTDPDTLSSSSSSSSCVIDQSARLELPVAVSQMSIADQDMNQPHSGSVLVVDPLSAKLPMPSAGGSCGDGEGVIGEDIGPQSDRYEHLARLLNTKFNNQAVNQGSLSSFDCESTTPIFDPYYLYVIEEPHGSKDDHMSKHIANLIKEYEKCEGKQIEMLMAEGAKSKGKGSKELYEKGELKHGDKVFHKFLKRLQTCPEQCIRYDRGGDPLLALEIKGENSVIPPCPLCGKPRIFELQLLPALIPHLCLKGSYSLVEFSTILIFTCQDNCVPSDPAQDLIEEVAICQEDPDQHLYR